MAAKKFKKGPSRKTVRRHRASTAGKVRLPLDVKSEKDLPAFKQLLSKKPLTIIMVYATWCPHCHTMMPHFDAAAKSPHNSVSPVKINETMLPSVNQYIQKNVNQSAKPIQVEGYPSILLVNQQAEKVGDVEIKRDTAYLSKVMSESGNLAKQAGINQSLSQAPPSMPSLNKNSVNRNSSANVVVEDVVENELKNASSDIGLPTVNSLNLVKSKGNGKNKNLSALPALSSIKNAAAPSPLPAVSNNQNGFRNNYLTPSKEMMKEADDMFSLEAPVPPVQPPSASNDVDDSMIISNTLSPEQKVGGYRGGSLLSAMARTTYTLAPAAALLATAAMVMKRSTFKKSAQKRHKKAKKSLKRRK